MGRRGVGVDDADADVDADDELNQRGTQRHLTARRLERVSQQREVK